MKHFLWLAAFILVLFATAVFFAPRTQAEDKKQTATGNVTSTVVGKSILQPEICKYKNGARAAYTFSFDDGYKEHFTIAAPLLEKYGFRGTFFIVIKQIGMPEGKPDALVYKWLDWEQIKGLHDRGHEIANHTITHQRLPYISPEAQEVEVNEPLRIIKEKFGFDMLTFCYPGNSYNKESIALVMKRHIASRLQCQAYGDVKFTTELANQRIDNLIKDGGDNVGMIHAILPGTGYQPFNDVSIFEKHLEYVKSLGNKIWVDTFANVSKYKLNRDACKLAVKEADATSCTVVIEQNKTQPIFADMPLTIRIPAIAGAEGMSFSAKQGDKVLPVTKHDDDFFVDVALNNVPVQFGLVQSSH